MSIYIGFALLGLLVGYLAGLSSSPIASTLLAAVFSFAGGTLVHYLNYVKIDRQLTGMALSLFAASCICGLTVGIVVKENRLFTLLDRQKALIAIFQEGPLPSSEAYLKSASTVSAGTAINQQYVSGEISAQQAYDKLWNLVEHSK